MQKLESELDDLTEEESELIKHIEIEEKKNNIEFLKSRLAKLRIKDKNAVLIDERENNIGHQQFRRGLQNKQSARAVEVNTDPRQSALTLQDLRSMQHLKRKAEQDMRFLQEDSSDEEVLIPENVGKQVKSGQTRKVTDQVKHELNWLHTNLKYAYANMQLNYCDLDFPCWLPGKFLS